jgi:hypothetical protein
VRALTALVIAPVAHKAELTSRKAHNIRCVAATAEWIKIKHVGYSQAQGRWELFDRRKR